MKVGEGDLQGRRAEVKVADVGGGLIVADAARGVVVALGAGTVVGSDGVTGRSGAPAAQPGEASSESDSRQLRAIGDTTHAPTRYSHEPRVPLESGPAVVVGRMAAAPTDCEGAGARLVPRRVALVGASVAPSPATTAWPVRGPQSAPRSWPRVGRSP